MASGSYLTPNYSRSQSEVQGDLHKCNELLVPQNIHFFIFSALAVAVLASLHEVPVHHHAPQPYKFGYSVKEKHGEQHREESGDGHAVHGSYGFTDNRGIHRQVNYVADHAGFRAQVKTNEPGTANQDPAAVHIISSAPYGHGKYAGAVGLGYAGDLGYAGY
ncbi:uncharacterized protein TNCV_4077801 [Trichonephila clavipes]|nr:uncharacterized protein TNCV_4077801 [Trichonephila clavipes]